MEGIGRNRANVTSRPFASKLTHCSRGGECTFLLVPEHRMQCGLHEGLRKPLGLALPCHAHVAKYTHTSTTVAG